jgi:addiction module HigA family antidote
MANKKKIKFTPIHPGEILQDAIDGAGITQMALARHIGVTQSKINDICKGRRGLSVEMSARLGKAFNQSTDFWYNLQKQYEIDSLDESEFDDIDVIAA